MLPPANWSALLLSATGPGPHPRNDLSSASASSGGAVLERRWKDGLNSASTSSGKAELRKERPRARPEASENRAKRREEEKMVCSRWLPSVRSARLLGPPPTCPGCPGPGGRSPGPGMHAPPSGAVPVLPVSRTGPTRYLPHPADPHSGAASVLPVSWTGPTRRLPHPAPLSFSRCSLGPPWAQGRSSPPSGAAVVLPVLRTGPTNTRLPLPVVPPSGAAPVLPVSWTGPTRRLPRPAVAPQRPELHLNWCCRKKGTVR